MKYLISCLLLLFVVCQQAASAGVDSKKAMYVGGTITTVKAGAEGKSSTEDETQYTFETKKDGRLNIPYTNITSLEYGQKAGRRVAVAILVTPLALFSKKRKHYLTIAFNDENGKAQAAIFELGKDIVRVTLATLEVRTGKQIEYQDDEARKSAKG
jgi:hypothetical protein